MNQSSCRPWANMFSRSTQAVLSLVLLSCLAGCPACDPTAEWAVGGTVTDRVDGTPVNGLVVQCVATVANLDVLTGPGPRRAMADAGSAGSPDASASVDSTRERGCGERSRNCPAGHYRCEGGGVGPDGEQTVDIQVEDPSGVYLSQRRSMTVPTRSPPKDPPFTALDFSLERAQDAADAGP